MIKGKNGILAFTMIVTMLFSYFILIVPVVATSNPYELSVYDKTELNFSNPKTGDMGIGIWVALMVISFLGIIGIIKISKKRKKKKHKSKH